MLHWKCCRVKVSCGCVITAESNSIEKEKKNEQEELVLTGKRQDAIEKKNKLAERKIEIAKRLKKKSKQKVKDEKKRLKKKETVTAKAVSKFRIPNIKEINENCKHIVDIDDVLYVVPVD